MQALQPFLSFHGACDIVRLNDENTSLSCLIGAKKLMFLLEEACCKAFVENAPAVYITLLYDELWKVEHRAFLKVVPLREGSLSRTECLQAIRAEDVAVRLSLCFPGDIVEITRPVLFTGAGIQQETMVRRVV